MFDFNLKLSLCRTCLVRISQVDVYNIFNTQDLAKKLMLCSALPVESTDKYPENVCLQCYENILLFYDFQQMCSKSLDTFNELLKAKEALVEDAENGSGQEESNTNDPLNGDLKETPVEPSDNVKNSNKLLEKKKRGRPPRKKLENLNPVRKTVIEKSTRSVIRKTLKDTSTLKDGMIEDLKEYLQFDHEKVVILENGNSFLNKDSLNEQSFKHFKIIGTEIPDSHTPTESRCNSSQKLTTQNHGCDRCSKSFNALHSLQAHIRQHDGFPPYTCTHEGCNRSFNRWHFYNKHKNEHNLLSQEKSFKCDLANCERVYKNKSALNIHKRKFHKFGPELKTHMCEICGKVFKSSAVLNDHHYTHIDKTQLPYACEEKGCEKRYSTKEKLKIHKMRHAGIKNFICPYCGMRKTTRNELKIHINYHTLERTWPCRFCPKVCNSAGNLRMHVRNMHERAKDFACRYCERTFAKADTKKYHEMTHTGEKPHECKECGRRFVQPAALRTHRKIHLKQKGKLGENPKRKTAIATEEIANTIEDTSQADILTESVVAEILSDTNENLN